MIRHRTKKQVLLFDIFKLITTIILLLIILYAWWSYSGETTGVALSEAAATPAASGPEEAQPTATEQAAQVEATATPSPPPATPTPEPQPAIETPPSAAAVEVTPPSLTLPAGALTAGEVALSGMGEPGSTLEIVVDGQVAGTVTVGSDGTWQTTIELPNAGVYEVLVRAIDSAGTTLAESELAMLTLLPVEVEATAESETAAEAEIITPTLATSTGALAAGEVALSGAGEPGEQVAVVVDGQTVNTVTVGSDGTWQTTVELPDAGAYEVQVRAIDSAGTTLAESEPTTLQVETAEIEPGAAAEVIPPSLTLPAGALTAGEVTLSGMGEPGSTLEIVVDGQVAGTTVVGSDGTWQTTLELPNAGAYELVARSVDDTGVTLAASEPATLQLGEAEIGVPEDQTATGQAYIVQADDWLSKLADKFYGDMFAYPAIVEATNAKAGEDSSFMSITNPDRIEIGQKLWIPPSP